MSSNQPACHQKSSHEDRPSQRKFRMPRTQVLELAWELEQALEAVEEEEEEAEVVLEVLGLAREHELEVEAAVLA